MYFDDLRMKIECLENEKSLLVVQNEILESKNADLTMEKYCLELEVQELKSEVLHQKTAKSKLKKNLKKVNTFDLRP